MRILFLGSNPSNKATSNEAFTVDTASGRTLKSWIQDIEGTIFIDNIVSQKTKNNRPLHQEEIARAQASLLKRIQEINPDRLVALGKSASNVLKNLNLKHFEMPHPSGRNRKLNDKSYVTEKINKLKLFCK
jgi:uracil-DNA glycosylase family 4